MQDRVSPSTPVPPRLRRVQERLHGGRHRGADALLGDPRELHRLPAVAEVDGLAAHRDEDVRAVDAVVGRLREAQGLYEVALRESVRSDVVRGPAREPRQVGRRGEEPAAGLLAVDAAQHRLGLVLQVADEGLPGVAAAVGVVEGAEEVGDRAQCGDVAARDLLSGAALAPRAPPRGARRGDG
ncbi:hypothetical protein GA0115246_105973, partial [Streptomyces sp. SolWspMP-sol7th]